MEGGRPKKKTLKLNDEETLSKILQEIYNENLELKGSIRKLFVKWERFALSEVEVNTIGKNIYDILNLLQRHHTTKLEILKFIRDYNLDTSKITLGYDKLELETKNLNEKSGIASGEEVEMTPAWKSQLRKISREAQEQSRKSNL